MSSPARSSVSATSAGQNGGGSTSNAVFPDDSSPRHFPTDLSTAQDRREETLLFLKSEVMGELDKVVKSLDEDSWMFARPRSQIHLLSKPGSHPIRQSEVAKR